MGGTHSTVCVFFHLADVIGTQPLIAVDRNGSLCTEWYLQVDNESDTCGICPAGLYCIGSKIAICGPSTYSTGGSPSCLECPPGKWIADAGTVADLHDSIDDCTIAPTTTTTATTTQTQTTMTTIAPTATTTAATMQTQTTMTITEEVSSQPRIAISFAMLFCASTL